MREGTPLILAGSVIRNLILSPPAHWNGVLPPDNIYVVVPCTFDPKWESKFTLTILTDNAIKIKKLQEVKDLTLEVRIHCYFVFGWHRAAHLDSLLFPTGNLEKKFGRWLHQPLDVEEQPSIYAHCG